MDLFLWNLLFSGIAAGVERLFPFNFLHPTEQSFPKKNREQDEKNKTWKIVIHPVRRSLLIPSESDVDWLQKGISWNSREVCVCRTDLLDSNLITRCTKREREANSQPLNTSGRLIKMLRKRVKDEFWTWVISWRKHSSSGHSSLSARTILFVASPNVH